MNKLRVIKRADAGIGKDFIYLIRIFRYKLYCGICKKCRDNNVKTLKVPVKSMVYISVFLSFFNYGFVNIKACYVIVRKPFKCFSKWSICWNWIRSRTSNKIWGCRT